MAGLKDYVSSSRASGSRKQRQTLTAIKQLGDCLGKGAFGSVYRALNWGTGETVAVKQIKLDDLPQSELRVIMVSHVPSGPLAVMDELTCMTQLEIDLLKNLNVSTDW